MSLLDLDDDFQIQQQSTVTNNFDPFAVVDNQEAGGSVDLLTGLDPEPFPTLDTDLFPTAVDKDPFADSDPFGDRSDLFDTTNEGANSFWSNNSMNSTDAKVDANTDANTDVNAAFEDLMADNGAEEHATEEYTKTTVIETHVETRPYGSISDEGQGSFGALEISASGSLLPPKSEAKIVTLRKTEEVLSKSPQDGRKIEVHTIKTTQQTQPNPFGEFGGFTISSSGALQPPLKVTTEDKEDSMQKNTDETKQGTIQETKDVIVDEKSSSVTVVTEITKLENGTVDTTPETPKYAGLTISKSGSLQPPQISAVPATPSQSSGSIQSNTSSMSIQVSGSSDSDKTSASFGSGRVARPSTSTMSVKSSESSVTVSGLDDIPSESAASIKSDSAGSVVSATLKTGFGQDQHKETVTRPARISRDYSAGKSTSAKVSSTSNKTTVVKVSSTGSLQKPVMNDLKKSEGFQVNVTTKSGSPRKEILVNHVSDNLCCQCNKRVYEMEKMTSDRGLYHKSCFKCQHCKRVLSLTNFAAMGGQLYCKPHFLELFKTKGNYEEGFGREKVRPVQTATPTPTASTEKVSVSPVSQVIVPPVSRSQANQPDYSKPENTEMLNEETLPSIQSLRSRFEGGPSPMVDKQPAKRTRKVVVTRNGPTAATSGAGEPVESKEPEPDMPSVKSSEDTPQSELPPAGFSRNLVAKFKSMEVVEGPTVSQPTPKQKASQDTGLKTRAAQDGGVTQKVTQQSGPKQDEQDGVNQVEIKERNGEYEEPQQEEEFPQQGFTRSLLAKWRSLESPEPRVIAIQQKKTKAPKVTTYRYPSIVQEEPSPPTPTSRKFKWEVKEARPLSRPAGPEHDYVLEPTMQLNMRSSSLQSLDDEPTESQVTDDATDSDKPPQSITQNLLDKFRSMEDVSAEPPTPEASEKIQKQAILASKTTFRKFSASSGDIEGQLELQELEGGDEVYSNEEDEEGYGEEEEEEEEEE